MNTLMTIAAHDPGHYGPGPWWPIFPIFWLVAFIAVILFNGEIDEDEYRARLAVLDEGRKGRP